MIDTRSTRCPHCGAHIDRAWTTGRVIWTEQFMCNECGHCWHDVERDDERWKIRKAHVTAEAPPPPPPL